MRHDVHRYRTGVLRAVLATTSLVGTALVATAVAQVSGSVFFRLGEGGSDVIPHQIVRTASDRLYIFTSKQSSTTIRVYRTTGTGLPSSSAAFAAPILLTAPSLPISLDAAYDGGSTVHVLVNTQAGQILDYPFDLTSDTFGGPVNLATDGGTVPTNMYIGTIGVAGMVDKTGTLHVTYWSHSNHILHRAYNYNTNTTALTPVSSWVRVDTAGSASHPAMAVSPADDSTTVAWVSEADTPTRIRARTRDSGGTWGPVERVSTASAWACTDTVANCNGVNIDQGPSLVIDSAGVKHLIYIEAFDYGVYGDYGRIHYAKSSGGSWTDQALNALSHAPTLAIDTVDALYIIGHGHEKNPSCRSQDVMCLITQASNGTWNAPQLLVDPPVGLSLDNASSVKWSVVGFNRPDVIEFISYATPYHDTTLYYGRVNGPPASPGTPSVR